MTVTLLLYNLKLNCLIFFSTGLNSSLIIFIRTYTVNCRNALDRLRVQMNIILFFTMCACVIRVSVQREMGDVSAMPDEDATVSSRPALPATATDALIRPDTIKARYHNDGHHTWPRPRTFRLVLFLSGPCSERDTERGRKRGREKQTACSGVVARREKWQGRKCPQPHEF